LLVKKKIGSITVEKWIFPIIKTSKYHNAVQNNAESYNPNTADITIMHFIISKTFPKDKIFQ
jgi:hypothetical protein